MIYTIGVYGWTKSSFLDALRTARVTQLVDIRQRRGLRGSAYSFANAQALQELIYKENMDYVWAQALAPSAQIRKEQKSVDQLEGVAKRERQHLSQGFTQAYNDMLARLPAEVVEAIMDGLSHSPALLCVEKAEEACHRKLAAEWIASKNSQVVEHLHPS